MGLRLEQSSSLLVFQEYTCELLEEVLQERRASVSISLSGIHVADIVRPNRESAVVALADVGMIRTRLLRSVRIAEGMLVEAQ